MAFLLATEDIQKLFFDSASDLAKQLIAVSTGVVGLSITFLKDVAKGTRSISGWLILSWFAYLLSIVCGFWTLMAVTGSISLLLQDPKSAPVTSNMRVPAGLQIVFFVSATLFLIIYGMVALRQLRKAPLEAPKDYRAD